VERFKVVGWLSIDFNGLFAGKALFINIEK
jgi:hypothetical protein